MGSTTVGVLALQGAFEKHLKVLSQLGAEGRPVRRAFDLTGCDALIIPGGESTVISRRIEFIGLWDAIGEFSKSKPVFGTCAGLILMSSSCRDSRVSTFGILDVEVERNGFGRQAESFSSTISLRLEEREKSFQALFIRAPRIQKLGDGVQVLASYRGEPVLVQQGFHLGAAFHPELTDDPRVHRYFLKLC